MKDVDNRYLYIGKAINLKSRVRSYFLDNHDDRHQIPFMLRKVATIEWIATNNETEALILESNLIKKHTPPYNLDLKDDKHFPYLKVSINEPFPRLAVTRKINNDGSKYFGPYTDAGTMRKVMDFAQKIFKIRSCKRNFPIRTPVRPCINYSIGQCNGPCAGNISEKEYSESISMLIQFLKGQRRDITALLEKLMQSAASRLDFEKAASLRDQINLIRKASSLQQVDLKTSYTDFDVFGTYDSDRHTCLSILCFRQGLLLSKRHFIFKRHLWNTPYTDHEPVVLHFYQNSIDDPPDEIILPPHKGFNKILLKSWFTKQYSDRVRVTIPQKGTKLNLVRLAEKNARLYIIQKAPDSAESNCREMKELLKLPRMPETIEAFDISNLGDKFAVAGMVYYKNGSPDKSHYRRYKIKTVEGQNDFAMLIEAVTRRLSRLQKEDKPFPDLLLIDGGKGQLSSVVKTLAIYPNPPMVIALAKKEEILFSPYLKKPQQLPQHHPVRKFVERIRDEVHRWVISYHRTIRGKQYHASSLETIPGIGKKRAKALLRRFGSIKRIKDTSMENIASVNGFSVASAKKLLEKLHA